jgi:radical SAM protein
MPSGDAYHDRPCVVFWELTRACARACAHSRAEAIPRRDPAELGTEEAGRLLEEIAAFGPPLPLVVFTGGDLLRRPDLVTLTESATKCGLRVALTPSGTAAVTEERLRRLKDAGLARLAVSLDGSTAALHDAFRGVRGSFGWTLRIIDRARALDLPLQVNTTITRRNLHDFVAMGDLLERFGIVLWSIFFLIPTGRARQEDQITAWEFECLLNRIYERSRMASFGIKTTEAPQYRRVVAERERGIRRDGEPRTIDPIPLRESRSLPEGSGRVTDGVNDGNGVLFVSHTGDVWPGGFLPLSAGNVRETSLIRLYQDHPIFRALRDPERLKGRCGICPYRELCGGSRARAYALRRDYLAEDSLCFFDPPPF